MSARGAALAGAVTFVLALAGCGGKEEEEYPASVQRNFLDACKKAGSSTKQCECALNNLEEKLSLKEFKREETAIEAGRPPSREITDAVADCR